MTMFHVIREWYIEIGSSSYRGYTAELRAAVTVYSTDIGSDEYGNKPRYSTTCRECFERLN